jgi:hypothetical protein
MKLVWRGGLAVAGLTVGTVNVLADRELLTLSPTTQVVIIVALAGVTFLDNSRLAVKRAQEPADAELHLRVQKALLGVLIAISETHNVRVSHLGSSIFVERRVGPLKRKTLVRRFRFRLGDYPPASDVQWEKGKGAVGTCWETGAAVHRDRRRVAEKYGNTNLNEAQFEKLSRRAKSGFTHDEFRSMVGKYAEVLAVPIKTPTGEFVGIVSVDLTVDASSGLSILEGRDMEILVTSSAAVVRDDINRL